MDSRKVVTRLKAQCQALAMMDRPSIASVFVGGDAETLCSGFVMEVAALLACDRKTDKERRRGE